MTDILALRVTAISATLLVLTYQYYRKVPLWIPIRWNFVLLLLNITMVSQLVIERQRARQMAPELERLYAQGKFQERGFSRVEFLRLYELAETVTLPAGHVLVEEGRAKDSLHFVLKGTVLVQKHNVTVAQLDAFHFVGEISLLTRLIVTEPVVSSHNNNNDNDENDSVDDPKNPESQQQQQSPTTQFHSAASADVVVEKEATFLKWDFETLVPYLHQDRQVRNALQAFINYDLTSKLLREGSIQPTTAGATTTTTTVAGNNKKSNNTETDNPQQQQPPESSGSWKWIWSRTKKEPE